MRRSRAGTRLGPGRRVAIVIDDKNPLFRELAWSRFIGGGCGATIRGGGRQLNDEFAAFPKSFAERMDGSAMQLHKPPHKRQSDAESTLRPLERMILLS